VYSANFSTISATVCRGVFLIRFYEATECLFDMYYLTFSQDTKQHIVRLRYTDSDYNLPLWYLQTRPIILNRNYDNLNINLVWCYLQFSCSIDDFSFSIFNFCLCLYWRKWLWCNGSIRSVKTTKKKSTWWTNCFVKKYFI
jgi:hypothetical protein